MVLQKNGDDRVYPGILFMATSNNPVYRMYALEAMNYLYDRRFYQILVSLLDDDNKSVRIYALKCIYNNQLKQALYLIRKSALNDGDDEVRVNAIEILGKFRDTGSLYVLLKTLSDNNRAVRYESALSLYKLRSVNSAYSISARLFNERDAEIKSVIIDTLVAVRKVGDVRGLKGVLLNDSNLRLKIKAAYAFGVIKDDRHVRILVRGLKDRDFRVRAEVCNSLGNYKLKSVVVRLLGVVKNDSVLYVRSAALYSLKRINNRAAILPLFDLYSEEADPVFRELLRQVLRRFIQGHV